MYLAYSFQSSEHKLISARPGAETSNLGAAAAMEASPGRGHGNNSVLQWLAGFGRRAKDPKGAPSQDLGPPGETSRTDSTFRGRESDP